MDLDLTESHLLNLKREYDALPDSTEPPPTTLQILGRSKKERDWQDLLTHFLSAEEAHGLNTAVLEQVLSGLSSRPDIEFAYSRRDLEDIQVEAEVATTNGRPDLVIWSDGNWFICIELKISSSETADQTQRYVDLDAFDGINLAKESIPAENHYYVYLAPANASEPTSDEFISLSWQWLVGELQSFLSASYGEYPARTTAQLTDFIDTIRSELTMTEHQANQREKVALALEHYEAITDVLDELEKYIENLQRTWPDWFLEENPQGWDENWHTVETDTSYAKIYRDEWMVNYPGDEENVKKSDLAIYWEIRLAERFLGENRINPRIIVTGQDDDLLDTFRKNFYSERIQTAATDELTAISADANKEIHLQDWSNNTYDRIVEGNYWFEFNQGQGFTATVIEAFEDLHPVFELITESVPDQ